MGMFDYFRSSYNLGEQFTNTTCQTKTIEEGYSGTLTLYWLDPKGVLWYPDYVDTSTFEDISEDDPRYDKDRLFLNFEWVPTGKRGKYKVNPITKYIEIYPERWEGEWKDWPTLRLHFKHGVLQDYERTTK